MAKLHSVLYERDNFIKNCINRGAVATFDVDGGQPVVLGAVNANDKELYDAAKFTTGKTQVAIAYNPSVKYDVIGGNLFPAKSLNDRNYTNPAGKVIDVFIPEKNIEFGVTMDGITGDTEPEIGEFLEPANGSLLWSIEDSQTTGVPSFEVVDIKTVKYPTFDFDEEEVKVFIVATRYNG